MVATALRRLNGNAVGALRTWRSRERCLSLEGRAMLSSLARARRCWFSLDYRGPREAPSWRPRLSWSRPLGGRDRMAVCASTNSPPTVMMKSRFPKCTCAPRTQLMLWLAICGLVWNAQRPLPGTPTVGVSNKHRLVNLYLCALGPDGALKDTRVILVRAECPYVQSVAARVISTEMVRSRGYKRSREGLVLGL